MIFFGKKSKEDRSPAEKRILSQVRKEGTLRDWINDIKILIPYFELFIVGILVGGLYGASLIRYGFKWLFLIGFLFFAFVCFSVWISGRHR